LADPKDAGEYRLWIRPDTAPLGGHRLVALAGKIESEPKRNPGSAGKFHADSHAIRGDGRDVLKLSEEQMRGKASPLDMLGDSIGGVRQFVELMGSVDVVRLPAPARPPARLVREP